MRSHYPLTLTSQLMIACSLDRLLAIFLHLDCCSLETLISTPLSDPALGPCSHRACSCT